MNAVWTPSTVWEGFDPYRGELNTKLIEEADGFKHFVFNALYAPDGEVVVDAEVYAPSFASRKTALICGALESVIQKDLVDKLVSKGMNVVVPDYSGVRNHSETRFPPSLRYGYFKEGGEHLTRVCPTPKETSYYLYAGIIRRTVTFIEHTLADTDVVIIGIKSGVEVALQAAGTDSRIIGLACIGAAGYREYGGIPKYASDRELEIEGELMSWLTGVSGTAYAKNVKAPVMVALGSNGTISDLDRVSNFLNLMPNNSVSLTVSSGYRDSIDRAAFNTVLQWLDGVFLGSVLPKLPSLKVEVNSSGELAALVRTDDSIKIKSARVYYSFGDNNHTTRYWRTVDGEFTGNGEYLAKIPVKEGDGLLFAYAEAEYVNGLILDGTVSFADLTKTDVKVTKRVFNPIIFQYPGDNDFIELNDSAIIMNGNICEGVLPIGLKGLYCAAGGMITYSIGRKKGVESGRILQIDTYSPLKKYHLTLKAARSDGDGLSEYTVSRELEAGDTFNSLRLTPNEFKDELFRPMGSWDDIKSLTVCESNVIIGKIMFV